MRHQIIKKMHYAFKLHSEPYKNKTVYLCNWAINPTEKRLASNINEVTCSNCLRIIKNWKFKK